MGRRRGTPIEIVEVAYRGALASSDRWLEDVLHAARPMLDLGGGVWAYEYDTNRRYAEWLSPPVVLGIDESMSRTVLSAFADTPRELNEQIHKRAGVITILSELLPTAPADDVKLGAHIRRNELRDLLGVNASDPSGRGVYFCAPSNGILTRSGAVVQRWQRVAAHVAAAARLRTAARKKPEAVLSPDGRVLHAEGAAVPHRGALTRTARGIERARSTRRRDDLDSLVSWRALTEGRWSLVDEIERDGKRVLFALPNAPSVLDPRRLTAMERVVARFVAMGHSNKLIAYELGIAEGTVGAHVHAILEKFGLRRRVEIVDRVTLLATATTREVKVSDEKVVVVTAPTRSGSDLPSLSRAERAVAELAARGLSNAEIAKRRRCSPRTVANQLASVFVKLGIESRSELAARF